MKQVDDSHHRDEHEQYENQLEEYKCQLVELKSLLECDPKNESILKLKSDLEELIALTTPPTTESAADCSSHAPSSATVDAPSSISASAAIASLPPTDDDVDEKGGTEKAIKKAKRSNTKLLTETFEIPPHLLPVPSDTTCEASKKRRTLKALKSKWRARVKSVETEVKQKSWQDFASTKKRVSNKRSIFATEDGIDARVGVIKRGTPSTTTTTTDTTTTTTNYKKKSK